MPLLLFLPLSHAWPLFQRVEGIEDSQIKRVAVSPLDENLIYVASKNSLFKSIDSGKTFSKVSVFKDEEVMHLFFDPHLSNNLYVAASRHLYKMTDRLTRIFSPSDEALLLTVAEHKDEIFAGTSDGLYAANQDILKWEKIKAFDTGVSVFSMDASNEQLYLATNKGVYLFKDKNNIQRIFVVREIAQEGEEESGTSCNIVKIDIFDKNRIWLGTSKGIFVSRDQGRHWEKMYIPSIDNLRISSLAQSMRERDALFIGTDKGFFKVDLETQKAELIFEGIYSEDILWVEFNAEGEIYLSTSKALFKGDYYTKHLAPENLKGLLDEEPSIGEIQESALKYNEVHPDKIRKWRAMLKARALLPSVNWSYDKTVTYDTGADHYVIGPRDWGLSFGWDLGDLFWNSYEDDVDTRSRLNTQLRLDILDEINRVYFERIRLRHELLNSSFNKEESFQKELRLRELTAILDGYTGGYFSKRAEELQGD